MTFVSRNKTKTDHIEFIAKENLYNLADSQLFQAVYPNCKNIK